MRKHIHQLTMITFFLHLSLLLPHFIITAATDNNLRYNPTEHILLDCGSSSGSFSLDSRYWDSDADTKFSPNINSAYISLAAPASKQDASFTDQVPYTTARLFLSEFSYNFPVSPGQKILRLYFYPATYPINLNKTQSFFGVNANHYTLLSNFSVFLAASVTKTASLVKEFIINVEETQVLNVTFLPSANSYAFVNGIEVVSTPNNLYMGNHDYPLRLAGEKTLYEFDQNKTAFETLYRLNVGSRFVSVIEDTGMYRQWSQDDNFIWGADHGNPLSNATISLQYTSHTPNYSAPAIVYTTARATGRNSLLFNLTWIFPVDSGFFYLLRLHFCEFMPFLLNATNQRAFTIFINNRTAEPEADVISWIGGTGIPIFRDYVVFVANPSTGSRSRQDLFLALHPNVDVKPMYYDAILNGLEIFKLNSSEGNLAVLKELEPNSKSQEGKKERGRIGMIFAIVGGLVGGTIILILIFLISRRRRGMKVFDPKSAPKLRKTETSALTGPSSLPSDLCRRFSLKEIKFATTNFDSAFVIGTGGFGNVYRGYIDPNLTAVAIKRLNPSSSQGAHEFLTEIEMLSNLRHRHLVSLMGYCDEKGEMILIYDYMAKGTLRDHLYRTENPPLPWKQRLQICIGAAKGLHYLHNGAKHNIIHRDVKSTNILLDEKWVAKVSDFGLSKLGPADEMLSHVSTQVKGSFGYVDPEYYKRQRLTDKSDVYSFGVVLFEVLCARAAVVPSLPREEANLAECAVRCYRKGTVDQIVDPNIKSQIAPECLRSYSEIAISCLKERGIERPAMSEVIWSLEFVLQTQEAADNEGHHRPTFFPSILQGRRGEVTTDGDAEALSKSGEGNIGASMAASTDKCKCDSIFSEILNPTGR